MQEINVRKLYKEFLKGGDEPDARNAEIPDDDMNFRNMKLKVKRGSMKWRQMSPPSLDLKRKVNVSKKPDSSSRSEAYGQIQTTNDAKDTIKVTIEAGMVKELGKMIKLPLEGTNKEVIANFGAHMKIDPSEAYSEIMNKVTLQVAVEQPIGAAGASATIHTKRSEYKGKFECKVVLNGLAITRIAERAPLQHEFSYVIQCLQDRAKRRHQQDDLRDLSATREEVEFTMKGEVEFLWGYDQTIELEDKAKASLGTR